MLTQFCYIMSNVTVLTANPFNLAVYFKHYLLPQFLMLLSKRPSVILCRFGSRRGAYKSDVNGANALIISGKSGENSSKATRKISQRKQQKF